MEVHTEKPKMKLTRPKTPELETMQRARPPRFAPLFTSFKIMGSREIHYFCCQRGSH
jgi:hypothetical protein